MAAEYFLEKGYVNFAMLSAGGYHFATLRQDGFEAKLAEHNYQPYIFKQKMLAYYEHEVVGGHSNLLNGWLKTLPLPIGIFACNDGLAMILNEACRQVGLTVGQDIAIIGVDNDENVCYMEYPPLSSIDLPTLTIGFKAGEMLDKLMNSEQIHEKQIFLKPKVVITRQSSEIMAVKDNDVKEAVLFINKNVAKSITVTDVCDEVCISKRSLEKKFKMALGYSPGHQILITHVRQAKQLLIETNNAVSKIAQMSGFNSPERMCVMFKKVIGLSPTNFRKQFMKF
jgi:LacI family transcriptional regulator